MPKGNSGRHKNSMAGRQSRDLTIKDVNLERVPNKWTDELVMTPEANKIMKIIQNAPVGTEITLKGKLDKNELYEEKYRITGTLRNKIIEPLGKYERYANDDSYDTTMTLKKTSLNKDSFVNIFSGSPDHSYDDTNLKIHMRKTAKTNAEKKAQKEESAIERRQLKLFR